MRKNKKSQWVRRSVFERQVNLAARLQNEVEFLVAKQEEMVADRLAVVERIHKEEINTMIEQEKFRIHQANVAFSDLDTKLKVSEARRAAALAELHTVTVRLAGKFLDDARAIDPEIDGDEIVT